MAKAAIGKKIARIEDDSVIKSIGSQLQKSTNNLSQRRIIKKISTTVKDQK